MPHKYNTRLQKSLNRSAQAKNNFNMDDQVVRIDSSKIDPTTVPSQTQELALPPLAACIASSKVPHPAIIAVVVLKHLVWSTYHNTRNHGLAGLVTPIAVLAIGLLLSTNFLPSPLNERKKPESSTNTNRLQAIANAVNTSYIEYDKFFTKQCALKTRPPNEEQDNKLTITRAG